MFCFVGLFFRWINSLIFITRRPYELPHWQDCGAVSHSIGQEELQAVSGRGGGNGNMNIICSYTCCNFKPQPLAVFSWVTATRKAKLLTAFSPFAVAPFCAPYSSLLALLLSYWPSSSLLQHSLSLLTQQWTIWTLPFKFVFFQFRFLPDFLLWQESMCFKHQYFYFIFLSVVSPSYHDRMIAGIIHLRILHVLSFWFFPLRDAWLVQL